MSRFFVGQRVKCVRLPPKPNRVYGPGIGCRVGDEGVVTGTASCPNLGFFQNGDCDISVKLDRIDESGMGPSYCFEPILPEGHRACDEDFKRDLDKLLSKEESRVS